MVLDKNQKTPYIYVDLTYHFTHTNFGTVIGKEGNTIFLQGDDEKIFLRQFNRAKQKGRDISDLLSEYFVN